MDSALQESLTKLFSRRNVYLFCIILLAAQVDFSNACQYELKSGERCHNHSRAVQEGGTLEVPLGILGDVTDLCIWNSSASSWISACQFVDGICQPLLPHFNKNISARENTFVMQNVRKNDSGLYGILDLFGNCMEVNVSVSAFSDSRPSVELIVGCIVGILIVIETVMDAY